MAELILYTIYGVAAAGILMLAIRVAHDHISHSDD